jgi:hypothetical protein
MIGLTQLDYLDRSGLASHHTGKRRHSPRREIALERSVRDRLPPAF